MAKYPRVSPFAANTIAGLYGKMNRFRDEINWAKEAIKLNFGYSNSYINLGNGYIGLGITDSARSSFLEAAQLDPKNPYAPYSLGVIEEDNKNYTQALEYYKQSVAIDSNFENGYYNLAATYANLKDFKNAEVCIEKVLKLDPTAADALQMQKHIKYNLKNQ